MEVQNWIMNILWKPEVCYICNKEIYTDIANYSTGLHRYSHIDCKKEKECSTPLKTTMEDM